MRAWIRSALCAALMGATCFALVEPVTAKAYVVGDAVADCAPAGAVLRALPQTRPWCTPPPHPLELVGDSDGDGLRDFVALDTTYGKPLLSGRRGTDGASLWSRILPTGAGVMTIDAARVGAPPVDGIVVTWSEVLGGSVEIVHVTAIDHRGDILWDRTIERDCAVPVVCGLYDFRIEGFLRVASDADDILVRHLSFNDGWKLLVLDGRDGTTESSAVLADPFSKVAIAPDLDGDGLEDVIVTQGSGSTPRRVSAWSGATLLPVWDNSAVPGEAPVAIGDVTGDGTGDLAGPGVASKSPGDIGAYLIDGADGSVVWSLIAPRDPAKYQAVEVRRLGDIDGDGDAEFGVARTDRIYADSIALRYFAFGEASTPIYEVAYTVPLENGEAVGRTFGAGDVDGDGIADAVHDVTTYLGAEQGAVSGATGQKIWSGPAGAPLLGTVDGSGSDLMLATGQSQPIDPDDDITVSAQDGATGTVLWSEVLTDAGTVGYDPKAVDLNGDGRGEVVISRPRYEGTRAPDNWVLDGATGTVLWTW